MMQPEWEDRVTAWIHALTKELYEPLGEINLEGFLTGDMLSAEEAERRAFAPMPEGTVWGRAWEYCWLRGEIVLPEAARGRRIVMDLNQGGEATLFVDGQAFGTRRADWVKERHHHISDQTLTLCGAPGQRYHLLMEAYAGHDYPRDHRGRTAPGPIIEGGGDDFRVRPESELRQRMGRSTFGIWHEEAYQLWKDVSTLNELRRVLDPASLRVSEIEDALERFTVMVDFEQPRHARLKDYAAAREMLRPLMAAKNGSTMPQFYAVGNAHIDICWLWPYRETQRKIARTFAAQVRMMDQYPEYKYVQSQAEAYQICKDLYPDLYERIREKVRAGQWIPEGSMWVEPDTNMTSGESLVRQLLYGKGFFRREFGVDCQVLWLPDTFGYSAVLPQLLKEAGVRYLTTQKIFWSYNGGDRFPYHYFTWQGMDGSEVTSFLHMDYTSRTDARTIVERWRDRVQKRGIRRFLLPFGYGDGGGGPTRDDLEDLRRNRDLEGVPHTRIETPTRFFEDCAADGGPKERYVGELYFQAHRGVLTSQAAIKRGNRKSELTLREAEIWSVAASGRVAWPKEALDECWHGVLLNQFHDILPGSSIERVYVEARQQYAAILDKAGALITQATGALTAGSGRTWFNSLSWERRALVTTDRGVGVAVIPPMGWTSEVDMSEPAQRVTVRPDGDTAVLSNGLLTIRVNRRGEIVSCTDRNGCSRIGGPANVLKLYKDVPRAYDAWDVDSTYEQCPVALEDEGELDIVEDTPWKCAVRVKRVIEGSALEQRISLQADRTRVDIDTEIDWQAQHRLLKAAFPTGIRADEALNEIQFGYIRRPTHRSRPYDADRYEVCNHRYTALCDENRGAAVLNESKYGVSMAGDTISLTLLRAPKSPDFHADQGHHRFAYSYYVWDGPLMDSDVVREGYELNVPVTEAPGSAETFSMMSVDAPNVVIDTVKQAEDGSGDIIIRLYESKRADTQAVLTLNLPARAAALCTLLEEEREPLPIDQGRVSLSFHPFEVKTLRVRG